VTPLASPDPSARQAELNRSVAGHWEMFADHRSRVTDLIVALTPPAGAVVCILGAGNCNDLDLARLLGVAADVHLIDVDPAAMRDGVERQHVAMSTSLHLHEADITGVLSTLGRWSTDPPSTNAEIDECLLKLARTPSIGVEPGSAHVAVSAAVLSQVTGTAVRLVDREHPRSLEVALSIRDAHLRLLTSLLRPSGWGVLITDAASSEIVDDLGAAADDSLPALLDEVVDAGQVHTGTDPLGLEWSLREEPRIARGPDSIVRHPPWLWRLGPDKVELTYALTFRAAPHDVVGELWAGHRAV
jgi:hypothetical protein